MSSDDGKFVLMIKCKFVLMTRVKFFDDEGKFI